MAVTFKKYCMTIVLVHLTQILVNPSPIKVILEKSITAALNFIHYYSLKKTIYFANEGFKISNKNEAERVKTIWLLKKTLDNCPDIKNYGKINKYCF